MESAATGIEIGLLADAVSRSEKASYRPRSQTAFTYSPYPISTQPLASLPGPLKLILRLPYCLQRLINLAHESSHFLPPVVRFAVALLARCSVCRISSRASCLSSIFSNLSCPLSGLHRFARRRMAIAASSTWGFSHRVFNCLTSESGCRVSSEVIVLVVREPSTSTKCVEDPDESRNHQ